MFPSLSLQACLNATFEDVAVLSECCLSARDSFLNLLVLVFVSGAVYLCQVDVALYIDIYIYIVLILK